MNQKIQKIAMLLLNQMLLMILLMIVNHKFQVNQMIHKQTTQSLTVMTIRIVVKLVLHLIKMLKIRMMKLLMLLRAKVKFQLILTMSRTGMLWLVLVCFLTVRMVFMIQTERKKFGPRPLQIKEFLIKTQNMHQIKHSFTRWLTILIVKI